jgi:hypothetical protein
MGSKGKEYKTNTAMKKRGFGEGGNVGTNFTIIQNQGFIPPRDCIVLFYLNNV